MSWSAGRCFAIQLSKIKLAHSSATFQVRKHTFKASVACNGREVLRGTPNAPKKLCFEGKPRSRRRAHERSEVAARSREVGTAFRRERPPIAVAIASRQPLTGAPNECRPQGGFPKTPLAQCYAERARGADSWSRSIVTARKNHMPPSYTVSKTGGVSIKNPNTHLREWAFHTLFIGLK